jgi:hypothetical protein
MQTFIGLTSTQMSCEANHTQMSAGERVQICEVWKALSEYAHTSLHPCGFCIVLDVQHIQVLLFRTYMKHNLQNQLNLQIQNSQIQRADC